MADDKIEILTNSLTELWESHKSLSGSVKELTRMNGEQIAIIHGLFDELKDIKASLTLENEQPDQPDPDSPHVEPFPDEK